MPILPHKVILICKFGSWLLIQIKVTVFEQCFHVVLFITPYKAVVQIFRNFDESPVYMCDHHIQIKATKQSFYLVLFIMRCKVVLTLKSVDETLVCDHLNESC